MDAMLDFANRHLWLSQVASIVAGLFVIGDNGWLGFGLLALGILSISMSISGGHWSDLTFQQRAAVVPGVVIGYLAVMLAIIFMYAFFTALRDEFNK